MQLNDPILESQRHSAVVVLLDLSTNNLILTKRSEHLSTHAGEVCFPGGFWEQGDSSLYDTALRELHEELGIEKERVSLIREMAIESTLLGSIIHPWLASISSVQPCNINKEEISKLILLPYHLVQDVKNYEDVLVKKKQINIKSTRFLHSDELIWGVTARIMKQLVVPNRDY